MVNPTILILFYIMWGLLVFTSICFLISGADDLFFDVFYWVSHVIRKIKYRHKKKLTYAMLASKPEQSIAVMIPCWHEAGIIDCMLRYNVNAIDYHKYDLFVGVYPNDPETIASVQSVANSLPHIRCVIGSEPGPTNKAKNLNTIYEYIQMYGKEHGIDYEIYVLNDSEDIIHPLSFKYFNYLIPHKDMVQIPVYPLEVSFKHFTHWTYNAEFCEIHTKDLIVRELIGGLVPSAGVGTAFSKHAIDILKKDRGGLPFTTNTLTEDYSTALQIRLKNMSEIFMSQYVLKKIWQKRWYLFGKPVQRIVKNHIATRALFPMSYSKAVKQKARWLQGIVFQEWINSGWQGNISTLYTLLHDRKSLFTHLISGLFFLLIPFWLLYAWYTHNQPDYPTLQDQFNLHPWVWYMIVIATVMMIGRILQRAIAVFRIYGIVPALYSIPLILYGNIINLHALLRAYKLFFTTPKTSTKSTWDKTDHVFSAQGVLEPYRMRIGDLLVKEKYLTKDQLHKAVVQQMQTGEQLGQILKELGYINEEKLLQVLAKQYNMSVIHRRDLTTLSYEQIPNISRYIYYQLMVNNCLPIKVTPDELSLAIEDPSNEVVLEKIMKLIKPYKAKFYLLV